MPTKMRRFTVNVPDDILSFLQRDCEGRKMQYSRKIISILTEYYRTEIPQPMIFGRSQPIAMESRRARPLVFRAPARPVELPASGRRASLGQGRS